MHLNSRKVTTLSKKRLPFCCKMCLENRGVIGNIRICRKCFYDNVRNTDYR